MRDFREEKNFAPFWPGRSAAERAPEAWGAGIVHRRKLSDHSDFRNHLSSQLVGAPSRRVNEPSICGSILFLVPNRPASKSEKRTFYAPVSAATNSLMSLAALEFWGLSP